MSPERKLFLDRLSLRNLAPRTVENYRHALIKLSQVLLSGVRCGGGWST
jgi:hypothetical protein